MLEHSKKKFVRWLDPKMEKYRVHQPAPKFTPQNLEEFIDVMRRTPKTILSQSAREKIAAALSFEDRTIKDIMHPKVDMIFVGAKELLGPLVIDKLYQSGFTEFPVVNSKEHVVGILYTGAFNSLKIKETDQIEKYMNENVAYLHESDSLEFMITEIHRTNSLYFLVQDASNDLTGFITVDDLFNYLLGKN